MLDRHQLTSDLLTDYALGFLSSAEASEVEAALEVHPEAREEVNSYLSGLSDLVMDLEPVAVPQGAADRLMARLDAELLQPQTVEAQSLESQFLESQSLESQSLGAGVASDAAAPGLSVPGNSAPGNSVPGTAHTGQNLAFTPLPAPQLPAVVAPARRNRLYALLAVAAAVAVGVAVLPGVLNSAPDFASRQGQQGAVSSTLNDKAGVPLADVVRLPEGQAYVQMRSALPAGRAYQAWKIEGGKPVSLGMFRGREYGSALPAGTVFAVTVEPEGGSEQPTTTPLLAQPI